MIPKECKRLAEVDFPIAEVSKHAAREKSIRHGHPSTLHLWWARRPLASSRAMLLELLLPDPCDPLCPEEFKDRARELLARPMTVWKRPGRTDEELRASLLSFIAEFANWDNAANPDFLEVSRGLVKAAYPEETPLVVDPFAGGGSIPLEALRLGCETFASDLNPVACLILKVMLEDIPRHGPKLAEELRRAGAEIKQQAEAELADLYPKDPDGATPIAYLWARTVRCEAPNCGAEIPLVRSFWLGKKPKRKRALRYRIVRPEGEPPRIEFEIFEPESDAEVPAGTVTRARATCPVCGAVLPPERVRAQLLAQHGGADVIFDKRGKRIGGARMLAVVTLRPGEQGRHYRLPTGRDYAAVWKAQQRLQEILGEWEKDGKKGLCPVPDEPAPTTAGGFLSPPTYGADHWALFCSARQRLTLSTIAAQVKTLDLKDIQRALALALGKLADLSNAVCRWEPVAECPRNVFAAGRVKPSWEFAEGVPIGDSSGSWRVCVDNLASGILSVGNLDEKSASIQTTTAQAYPLPDASASLWFTDPPYYFSLPYADLSDFFLVWLKRSLADGWIPDPFDLGNRLSPKVQEITEMAYWDKVRFRNKDAQFFENETACAFAEGRRVLREDGIGSVIFAHKTTEGWEALLSGLIQGGWTITGSWPIATEMGSRLRARESAALATSVHLVCRPRPEDAPVGDWADVLRELPKRVGDWIERLQAEGVRGADLVFACIGPALEIFSRYSRVETAEGREVDLAEYLEKVWEVVGRTALEQVLGTAEAKARNGAAGAIEEDARLTALFLWTLQSTDVHDASEKSDSDEDEVAHTKPKGYSLVFDVVRRFAQPLGIDLAKWEGRIIETKKGVVRLLSVPDRAEQLFGKDGAGTVADWIEEDPSKGLQRALFPELEKRVTPKARGRRRKAIMDTNGTGLQTEQKATTLDRVHAAMLLQASGQANALRALIKAELQRGPEFLRLANALSALYPKTSEEKRLLDAMLLAVPR